MKNDPPSLPTYSKIILSSWPAIAEIISKYTKVKKQSKEGHFYLLSEDQIREVFLDPKFTFVQYCIATQAKALQAWVDLNKKIGMFEKQKNDIVQILIILEEYLEKDKRNPQLIEAIASAKSNLADIKKTQTALQKRYDFFKALQIKINKLLYSQDAQWEAWHETWSTKMIQAFEDLGIQLTALEKNEIKRPKTIAELVERMKELSIPFPKKLSEMLLEHDYD